MKLISYRTPGAFAEVVIEIEKVGRLVNRCRVSLEL
jgi:hypothetical protein